MFFLKKLLFWVFCLFFFSGLLCPNVSFALEPDQKKLARNDQYLDAKGCNFTGQVDSNINAPNSEIYSSGLSGPYILEQWAIHTLKAIAKKQNIDESKTVTKEHVIALVAFALGEGGDIMNQDLYNPLNTGINASELIEGSHSVSGVQAFKSFDAGVEATARTMVGSNQNRLAKTLSNPDSSAKDFMKALTYYQKFSGNKLWAEASMPPRQDSYFNERLDLVKQVRKDYSNIASYVIGTRTLEQADGKREKSKLVFDAADTFFSGLFWLLIMNAIVALITLAPARFFAIRDSLKGSSSGAKYLAVLSKALGGAAFFLSAVAISLGSVSIVNALGGLQLVFLFILT
ncbi:MAG: hypothetical protein AAB914_03445, partial [Patescibacteria group bacterium]